MLSSYDLASIALIGITIAGYGYVTYSALAIRRTIAGAVYRKQAQGIVLVAILYAINSSTSYYSNSPTPADLLSFTSNVSFALAFVMIFYWVDTSVLAARLTDPLLRDSLHWSRLRFVIWAIILAMVLLSFSYQAYLQVYVGGFPSSPPLLLLVGFVSPAYISVTSGAVVLLVAVRRTADRTLRKHLQWFGFYLLFLLVFAGGIGNGLAVYSIEWSNIVGGVANAAGAILLYKSTKSLIPLYKFSAET